jgi:hypothetical protein
MRLSARSERDRRARLHCSVPAHCFQSSRVSKVGRLRTRVGYNANFRAPGIQLQQNMPVAYDSRLANDCCWSLMETAPARRLLLAGERPAQATRSLAFKWCCNTKRNRAPDFRSPTISSFPQQTAQGLGTERVDHDIIALVSKMIGRTTVDFNAGFLFSGRTTENGHASSG